MYIYYSLLADFPLPRPNRRLTPRGVESDDDASSDLLPFFEGAFRGGLFLFKTSLSFLMSEKDVYYVSKILPNLTS